MSVKTKLAAALIFVVGLVFISYSYLRTVDIPVLNPSGPIGQDERNLILLAVGLSLIVVIPVYFMLIFWHTR